MKLFMRAAVVCALVAGVGSIGACAEESETEAVAESEGSAITVADPSFDIGAAISRGRSLRGAIGQKEVTVQPGRVYTDGDLAPGEIAITIDDGPNGTITTQFLDLLGAYGTRANFFLVGKNVHGDGVTQVKRMAESGHSISNHSWDHTYFDSIGASAIEKQIRDTDAVLDSALAGMPRGKEAIFRFPGGVSRTKPGVTAQVTGLGKAVMHWNLDTHDTSVPDRRIKSAWTDCASAHSASVREYGQRFCDLINEARKESSSPPPKGTVASAQLLEKLTLEVGLHSIEQRRGGILLMHDKHAYSPYYLNGILEELAAPKVLRPLAEKLARERGIDVSRFKFTAVVLRTP
jgi:peptidoglycan/xylan/chitin deacetylase (PgdA/CDA1 family)